MVAKNRCYRRSRISEAKFRKLVRCFAMDLTATVTAEMTGISLRSVNTIYLKIRERMAEACEQAFPLNGALEVDLAVTEHVVVVGGAPTGRQRYRKFL